MSFLKKKTNVASSKSYRGSKAISEGVGVILNLRGGSDGVEPPPLAHL